MGDSALLLACDVGATDAVTALLQHLGILTNLKDAVCLPLCLKSPMPYRCLQSGRTALMKAVSKKYSSIVQLLRQHDEVRSAPELTRAEDATSEGGFDP